MSKKKQETYHLMYLNIDEDNCDNNESWLIDFTPYYTEAAAHKAFEEMTDDVENIYVIKLVGKFIEPARKLVYKKL